MQERIVSVAINNGSMIWSLPSPARHHSVLRAMSDFGIDAITHGNPDAQGFMTSTGRYVGRREAAQIAQEAGQIDKPKWPPELFSEDLW